MEFKALVIDLDGSVYRGNNLIEKADEALKFLDKKYDTICEEDCDCVLVGLDKEFNYTKMSKALNIILNGAVFIATNNDPFLITSEGVKPGAGSLVTAIETASGKKAIVKGKPSAFVTDLTVKELKAKPEEILIVGDNLQTDILMGIKGGMKTALVLTGASKLSDIERLQIRPDHIFESITKIPPFLDKTPATFSILI